jgi:DNA-binding beta-propeller fold protein YncE
MSLLTTVEVGRSPFTIRVTEDSQTAVVSNIRAGTASVVDLRNYSIRFTLDNGSVPPFAGSHGLALIPRS